MIHRIVGVPTCIHPLSPVIFFSSLTFPFRVFFSHALAGAAGPLCMQSPLSEWAAFYLSAWELLLTPENNVITPRKPPVTPFPSSHWFSKPMSFFGSCSALSPRPFSVSPKGWVPTEGWTCKLYIPRLSMMLSTVYQMNTVRSGYLFNCGPTGNQNMH